VDAKTHWEKVYATKTPDAVSWYRRHLETSLALIERAAPVRSASIIDVGGGEYTPVFAVSLAPRRESGRAGHTQKLKTLWPVP
jgi:hypothetical protein